MTDPRPPSVLSPRLPSRTSSARASPVLKDDLPLPPLHPQSPIHQTPSPGARVPYISIPSGSLLHPDLQPQAQPTPHFEPFFTLIEDASTGETAHAAVHYIFADDEPDIVTAAALHALSAADTTRRVGVGSGPPTPTAVRSNPEPRNGNDTGGSDGLGVRKGIATGSDMGEDAEDRERYVVVDLEPDGRSVAGAKSLSPDWAVTGTVVRTAPAFGLDDGSEAALGHREGAGLMLKIQGVGLGAVAGEDERSVRAVFEQRRGRAKGDGVGAMVQLLEGLRKDMHTLEKVVVGEGVVVEEG